MTETPTPTPTELPAELGSLAARFGGLPLPRLVEALREDQARRWRAGRRLPAEAYLGAFPALRDSADDALVLIWGEVLLRFEAGEAPQLPDYQARFPRHAEALALQFDLEGHLRTPCDGMVRRCPLGWAATAGERGRGIDREMTGSGGGVEHSLDGVPPQRLAGGVGMHGVRHESAGETGIDERPVGVDDVHRVGACVAEQVHPAVGVFPPGGRP